MTKREILIGGGGFAAAVLLAGGGWLVFGQHTVGNHLISLDQTAAAQDSGGLSVTSGDGGTGQLSGNTSQSGTGQGSSNGSSSSSSSGLDPSTFKQYDKYKDGQSGLFAEVQPGTGAELTAGKKATVIYKGWLTDGTLFDQSKSFSFTEGAHRVIPGWEEAISGMKVGGIRLMIVPPAVGYGAQGQGPVPGNAVLVFLVQLVAVE